MVAPKPTESIAVKEQTGAAAGRNVMGGAAAIAAAMAAIWTL